MSDSSLPDPTGDPAHHLAAPWEPPTGEAAPDPDVIDDAELREPDDTRDATGGQLPPPNVQAAASTRAAAPTAPPDAVTPLPGADPVAGQPWTVRVQTAAGVSSVAVEIDGSDHDVVMTKDHQEAGQQPTWSAQLDVPDDGTIRYRYAWRSSWNGDVTEWMTASSDRTCDG